MGGLDGDFLQSGSKRSHDVSELIPLPSERPPIEGGRNPFGARLLKHGDDGALTRITFAPEIKDARAFRRRRHRGSAQALQWEARRGEHPRTCVAQARRARLHLSKLRARSHLCRTMCRTINVGMSYFSECERVWLHVCIVWLHVCNVYGFR